MFIPSLLCQFLHVFPVFLSVTSRHNLYLKIYILFYLSISNMLDVLSQKTEIIAEATYGNTYESDKLPVNTNNILKL